MALPVFGFLCVAWFRPVVSITEQAALLVLGGGVMLCCGLGFAVFVCVEGAFSVVEWADDLIETKSDGEARRD
jgi:hypothetical protein